MGGSFASKLRCDDDAAVAGAHWCCRALVRKFQGPHMQDIIATAFEAAGVPHVDPSSPRTQPPLTRRSGEAGRRAALAGRLFRLLSPAALRLVHDMGMATTVATNGPNACTCLCVCMCHGHAPCLRRLLRHPACDVGAACCELPPPLPSCYSWPSLR